MWKNKFVGVLGIWVILLDFLDFSVSLRRFFLVITGLSIVVVAFWGNKIIKPTEEIIKRTKAIDKEINNNAAGEI